MSKILTKPNYGQAILKPLEEGEQTYGNIIIPDMGKEKAQIGVIIELTPIYNFNRGEEVLCLYNVGDTVVYSPMAGQKVTLDKVEYIVISINDIAAQIIEN